MLPPVFNDVWAAFPDHQQHPNMGALYRYLGGGASQAIDWPGFGETGNTCASRISAALNGAGFPIDLAVTGALDISTIKTSDGTHIIFRVRDLKRYLAAAYGQPDADVTAPFCDQFKGRRGIVAFTVQGWSDASGHIALYDGGNYRENDHDDVEAVYPEVTVVCAELWTLR